MSKNHQPISATQLERREAAQAKRQRWDRFWTIVILVIMVGIIGLVIAIQISHHL
jgi:heme/copper-type cytochrome/quinol oxidase subunit 2